MPGSWPGRDRFGKDEDLPSVFFLRGAGPGEATPYCLSRVCKLNKQNGLQPILRAQKKVKRLEKQIISKSRLLLVGFAGGGFALVLNRYTFRPKRFLDVPRAGKFECGAGVGLLVPRRQSGC